MAKVIDLSDRMKLKEDLQQTEKLAGLMAVVRCHHCAMRCAKCGAHGEPTKVVTHSATGAVFRLCAACHLEYEDLLVYLAAEKRPASPSWHNREWVRQWLAWIEYRWALSNYMSSAEVLTVLSELPEG